jgi:hypothetical protein
MKTFHSRNGFGLHVPTKRGAVRIGWRGDGYHTRRFFAGRTVTGWSVYALGFCVCYAGNRVTR